MKTASVEVAILNFQKKNNKLYFISKNGNLVEMDPVTYQKEVVATPRIKKMKGYFYFLNKKGNIARFKPQNL